MFLANEFKESEVPEYLEAATFIQKLVKARTERNVIDQIGY
jgi:hypothetical protein